MNILELCCKRLAAAMAALGGSILVLTVVLSVTNMVMRLFGLSLDGWEGVGSFLCGASIALCIPAAYMVSTGTETGSLTLFLPRAFKNALRLLSLFLVTLFFYLTVSAMLDLSWYHVRYDDLIDSVPISPLPMALCLLVVCFFQALYSILDIFLSRQEMKEEVLTAALLAELAKENAYQTDTLHTEILLADIAAAESVGPPRARRESVEPDSTGPDSADIAAADSTEPANDWVSDTESDSTGPATAWMSSPDSADSATADTTDESTDEVEPVAPARIRVGSINADTAEIERFTPARTWSTSTRQKRAAPVSTDIDTTDPVSTDTGTTGAANNRISGTDSDSTRPADTQMNNAGSDTVADSLADSVATTGENTDGAEPVAPARIRVGSIDADTAEIIPAGTGRTRKPPRWSYKYPTASTAGAKTSSAAKPETGAAAETGILAVQTASATAAAIDEAIAFFGESSALSGNITGKEEAGTALEKAEAVALRRAEASRVLAEETAPFATNVSADHGATDNTHTKGTPTESAPTESAHAESAFADDFVTGTHKEVETASVHTPFEAALAESVLTERDATENTRTERTPAEHLSTAGTLAKSVTSERAVPDALSSAEQAYAAMHDRKNAKEQSTFTPDTPEQHTPEQNPEFSGDMAWMNHIMGLSDLPEPEPAAQPEISARPETLPEPEPVATSDLAFDAAQDTVPAQTSTQSVTASLGETAPFATATAPEAALLDNEPAAVHTPETHAPKTHSGEVSGIPAGETPEISASEPDAPAEHAPETHAHETPAHEAFVHEIPVHETPAHEAFVHEIPVHETPAHEAFVSASSMPETPVFAPGEPETPIVERRAIISDSVYDPEPPVAPYAHTSPLATLRPAKGKVAIFARPAGERPTSAAMPSADTSPAFFSIPVIPASSGVLPTVSSPVSSASNPASTVPAPPAAITPVTATPATMPPAGTSPAFLPASPATIAPVPASSAATTPFTVAASGQAAPRPAAEIKSVLGGANVAAIDYALGTGTSPEEAFYPALAGGNPYAETNYAHELAPAPSAPVTPAPVTPAPAASPVTPPSLISPSAMSPARALSASAPVSGTSFSGQSSSGPSSSGPNPSGASSSGPNSSGASSSGPNSLGANPSGAAHAGGFATAPSPAQATGTLTSKASPSETPGSGIPVSGASGSGASGSGIPVAGASRDKHGSEGKSASRAYSPFSFDERSAPATGSGATASTPGTPPAGTSSAGTPSAHTSAALSTTTPVASTSTAIPSPPAGTPSAGTSSAGISVLASSDISVIPSIAGLPPASGFSVASAMTSSAVTSSAPVQHSQAALKPSGNQQSSTSYPQGAIQAGGIVIPSIPGLTGPQVAQAQKPGIQPNAGWPAFPTGSAGTPAMPPGTNRPIPQEMAQALAFDFSATSIDNVGCSPARWGADNGAKNTNQVFIDGKPQTLVDGKMVPKTSGIIPTTVGVGSVFSKPKEAPKKQSLNLSNPKKAKNQTRQNPGTSEATATPEKPNGPAASGITATDITGAESAITGPATSGLATSGLAASGLAASGPANSGITATSPAASGPAQSNGLAPTVRRVSPALSVQTSATAQERAEGAAAVARATLVHEILPLEAPPSGTITLQKETPMVRKQPMSQIQPTAAKIGIATLPEGATRMIQDPALSQNLTLWQDATMPIAPEQKNPFGGKKRPVPGASALPDTDFSRYLPNRAKEDDDTARAAAKHAAYARYSRAQANAADNGADNTHSVQANSAQADALQPDSRQPDSRQPDSLQADSFQAGEGQPRHENQTDLTAPLPNNFADQRTGFKKKKKKKKT